MNWPCLEVLCYALVNSCALSLLVSRTHTKYNLLHIICNQRYTGDIHALVLDPGYFKEELYLSSQLYNAVCICKSVRRNYVGVVYQSETRRTRVRNRLFDTYLQKLMKSRGRRNRGS